MVTELNSDLFKQELTIEQRLEKIRAILKVPVSTWLPSTDQTSLGVKELVDLVEVMAEKLDKMKKIQENHTMYGGHCDDET